MMNEQVELTLNGKGPLQESLERQEEITTYRDANWSEKKIEGVDYFREPYKK
jgi:hypothetical protein